MARGERDGSFSGGTQRGSGATNGGAGKGPGAKADNDRSTKFSGSSQKADPESKVTAQNTERGQKTAYGKDVDPAKSPGAKKSGWGAVFDGLKSLLPGSVPEAMAAVAPFPVNLAARLGMMAGEDVDKVQEDVDAGRIKSTRKDDPSMGRVDVINGRAYSHGNPASDSREANANGLGGGMVGGGHGMSGRINRMGGLMTPQGVSGQEMMQQAPQGSWEPGRRGLLTTADTQPVVNAQNSNARPNVKFPRYVWDGNKLVTVDG